MEERARVEMALHAVRDTKGEDVVVYDMENRSSITDYVLICSGRSQAHVRGIADRILEHLRTAGLRHGSMEGYQEGSWVLLDYGIMLIHVFHPDTRAYYDLEGLLQDHPCERFSSAPDGGAISVA